LRLLISLICFLKPSYSPWRRIVKRHVGLKQHKWL
jgi:hypothetical protein